LSYSDRCYRIALFSNRDDPVKANQMRETEAAARALGMTVQVNWVRDHVCTPLIERTARLKTLAHGMLPPAFDGEIRRHP
jgi:hypothetical protein